jgi:hypothetical protein
MGQYIANVHIADDYYVNFGDASPTETPPGELIYQFGKSAQDARLAQFGAFLSNKNGISSAGAELAKALRVVNPILSCARSLAAMHDAAQLRNAPCQDALVRDSWYPHLGLMTARTASGSAKGFYLAMQAASNGRSHGHNDSGSFIVYYDGTPVIIDVGVEAYSAKTFGPERYSLWTMQSAYHNLPQIGDVMQQHGALYRASEVMYESDDAKSVVSLNLAPAYPPQAGLKRWIRRLTLNRKMDRIQLEEFYELSRNIPVTLTLMTSRVPEEKVKGHIELRAADPAGRIVCIDYDSTKMSLAFEKIALTDEWLRRSWGDEIYRILLKSRQAVSKGKWSFDFN